MEKIIGIIFGKKNTPWQRIDAAGNAIDVAAGEFDAHPVYAGIQDETIDGQQMVRVPAFYYRAGRVAAGEFAGKKALWISDEPADGFALHPAFVGARVQLDRFWVGKYQGTPDGDKLGSQPGLMPLANIDFPAMQRAAAARNGGDVSGFGLWSIYHLGAVFVPKKMREGRDDSAFGNYFWAWENAVAYHGGYWSGGAHAGLFCLPVSHDASYSYSSIGGRLAKV